jgi:hypothetical protein
MAFRNAFITSAAWLGGGQCCAGVGERYVAWLTVWSLFDRGPFGFGSGDAVDGEKGQIPLMMPLVVSCACAWISSRLSLMWICPVESCAGRGPRCPDCSGFSQKCDANTIVKAPPEAEEPPPPKKSARGQAGEARPGRVHCASRREAGYVGARAGASRMREQGASRVRWQARAGVSRAILRREQARAGRWQALAGRVHCASRREQARAGREQARAGACRREQGPSKREQG